MCIEKTVRRYVDYWTAPAPQPRSISILESIARKIGVRWRPTDGSAFLIAHQAANDESRYYENQLAEYDPDIPNRNIDEDALDNAHQNEIRHRIFKSIYWGNLYDDLMPIEARSFTTTGQRKAKLALMIIAACILYSVIYFLPSLAYDTTSNKRALFHTSEQVLREFSTPDFAESYLRALTSAGTTVPKAAIDDPQTAIMDAIAFKAEVLITVKSSAMDVTALSESPIWLAATDDHRELLLTDALFFQWTCRVFVPLQVLV